MKKQKEKHASDMEKCKISRSTWNWFMEYVKCPHLVCEKMFPNSLIFFIFPCSLNIGIVYLLAVLAINAYISEYDFFCFYIT